MNCTFMADFIISNRFIPALPELLAKLLALLTTLETEGADEKAKEAVALSDAKCHSC